MVHRKENRVKSVVMVRLINEYVEKTIIGGQKKVTIDSGGEDGVLQELWCSQYDACQNIPGTRLDGQKKDNNGSLKTEPSGNQLADEEEKAQYFTT